MRSVGAGHLDDPDEAVTLLHGNVIGDEVGQPFRRGHIPRRARVDAHELVRALDKKTLTLPRGEQRAECMFVPTRREPLDRVRVVMRQCVQTGQCIGHRVLHGTQHAGGPHEGPRQRQELTAQGVHAGDDLKDSRLDLGDAARCLHRPDTIGLGDRALQTDRRCGRHDLPGSRPGQALVDLRGHPTQACRQRHRSGRIHPQGHTASRRARSATADIMRAIARACSRHSSMRSASRPPSTGPPNAGGRRCSSAARSRN